jgi:hypothetical protein
MKLTRRIDFEEFLRNIPAIFAGVAKRNEVVIVEAEGESITLQPTEQHLRRRLSDDEVAAGFKALDGLKQLRAQMLAHHDGKPFAESWEDIRQDREDRSKQWL